MSVCLLAYLKKPHIRISPNFLYMLPATVAASWFNGSAIRYVLLVSCITSFFHTIGQWVEIKYNVVLSSSPDGSTGVKLLSTFADSLLIAFYLFLDRPYAILRFAHVSAFLSVNSLSPTSVNRHSRNFSTWHEFSPNGKLKCCCGAMPISYKNSSGDEIANVNFLTTISHTRRPTSKYRKRDKPTSFNTLDDR